MKGNKKKKALVPPGSRRNGAAPAPSPKSLDKTLAALNAWLNDYGAVARAVGRHGDLERKLDAGGGLVKLSAPFLPQWVAEAALAALRALPPDTWNATAAARDLKYNNIAHAFDSTKGQQGGGKGGSGSGGSGSSSKTARAACAALQKLFRAVGLLLPGEVASFSAARYGAGHHIEPHDDRAYTDVSQCWGG
jgi:hypothetical protein